MLFGVHVGTAKKFAGTVGEAIAAGCDCIQIFAGNPRAFALGDYDAAAWKTFADQRRAAGIAPTVIHTSYLVNLASGDASLRRKGVALVARDLDVAARAQIEYVNTHLGSYGSADRKIGFKRVCKEIEELVRRAKPGPMLLMENSAGSGAQCGGTIEELGEIIAAVDSPRLGVCLDTAHAWASGYEISSAGGVKKFLNLIEKHIGFERVRALHLNDTEVELGGRRDRHWHVGKGKIGEAGFQNLLRSRSLAHVACICETPKSPELDRENVATVRRLAGRPKAGTRRS